MIAFFCIRRFVPQPGKPVGSDNQGAMAARKNGLSGNMGSQKWKYWGGSGRGLRGDGGTTVMDFTRKDDQQ